MIRTLMMALGVAAVMSGMAVAPARADDGDWHHGRGEWRDREWRGEGPEGGWRRREWCEYHPYACGYPGYVYGAPPPPVYYAAPLPPPPPVVYAPPSANFFFSFR